MDIFNVLSLLGGIALFLFGMTYMGESLKKLAGHRMKIVLTKVTANPFTGFLVGLIVTMVIQSSTATNVMVLSFVNAGMMTLVQAIPLVIGANLGTTITAWIISLSSIDGVSLALQLLKPSSFIPILIFIGVILYRFTKQQKKQDIGAILIGFALLMYGMTTMSSSMSGLNDIPEFTSVINALSNPLLGLVVGIAMAGIMQSSSASVGILQALALSGSITFQAVIPLVMGINIGQVVPVLIASSGTTKNAKRVAVVDLLLNATGAIVFLPIYVILCATGVFPFNDVLATPVTIAIMHSGYKFLCIAWQLPCRGFFEKTARIIVKESKNAKESLLDRGLLATPSLALAQCHMKISECIDVCIDSFSDTISLIDEWDDAKAAKVHDAEDMIDNYQDEIDAYLSTLSSRNMTDKESKELSSLLRIIADAENISDHIYHMVVCISSMWESGKDFSDDSKIEIKEMADITLELLKLSGHFFHTGSIDTAKVIVDKERELLEACENSREAHIERLKKDASRISISTFHTDIILDLERIGDHLSKTPRIVVL